MRTLDFAPFYRSTVGFDRYFSMLDQINGLEGAVPGYPPYNIERVSEGRYRISVAVAGFTEGELSLEVKENKLTIRGEKRQQAEDKTERVHRYERTYGSFERAFSLPTTVDPEKIAAQYSHGVLTVTIPKAERARPREIPVKVS